MKPKYLLKIANISGWLLLLMTIFYFISGYAMLHEYGFDHLMHKSSAWALHKYMSALFITFLVLHIVPYYIVRKQIKKLLVIFFGIAIFSLLCAFAIDTMLNAEAKPYVKIEQKENNTVKCNNCPNECIIKQGEKGKCKKFENINGKIQAVTNDSKRK